LVGVARNVIWAGLGHLPEGRVVIVVGDEARGFCGSRMKCNIPERCNWERRGVCNDGGVVISLSSLECWRGPGL
jgi:hypothetical protein